MTDLHSRRPSRFVRLARVCNRHRWRTVGVWLLALVVVQVIASSVGTSQLAALRLPGTESQRAYDLLAGHFLAAKGDTDQIVYRTTSGTLADRATQTRIRESLRRVAADGHVASVRDPFGPGGRLTRDGQIGVASVSYRRGTDEIATEDPALESAAVRWLARSTGECAGLTLGEAHASLDARALPAAEARTILTAPLERHGLA